MGAWGPGLYQDDVTCDIKEEYVNWLKIEKSNLEATINLIKNSEVNDMEDGPIFWFALADTQWKYGRLLPEVKDEAIKHIKSGIDLKRWEGDKKQYEKRKKVLEDLEKKLNSEQPPEKKVSKLVLNKPHWEVGDVLLYQIKDESLKDNKWYGKYVLLRVIGIRKTNIGSLPREYSHEFNVACIYNWVGNGIPDLNIIDKLKFIIEKNIFNKQEKENLVLSFSKRELEKLKIKVVLKDKTFEEKVIPSGATWPNINNIDWGFANSLKTAEEAGILIDETSNNR